MGMITIHVDLLSAQRHGRPFVLVAAYLAVASLTFLPRTGEAQSNQLVDLGVTYGHAINNSGQVALDTGIWINGTVTALPALPGGTIPAIPLAINASGQAAGTASSPTTAPGGGQIGGAIVYSNGTLTNLGVPLGDPTLDYAGATAINASGVVVGWSVVRGGGSTNGFIYSSGAITRIGVFPGVPSSIGSSWAYGINDSGQITGTAFHEICSGISAICTDFSAAFIYSNGILTDLMPGAAGAGYAINASGQVTGEISTSTGGAGAFLYTGSKIIDLGALPGGSGATGFAINATAQIVGSSGLAGASGTHAFFYNGAITDLNNVVSATDPLKQYVTLQDAQGINDSRLIVANGVDSRDGKGHTYLLQGPWVNIAPGPLSFDSEAIGAVSAAQTVTLTNAGTMAVSLGSPLISGDFTQTNTCSASLAPGGSCTFAVTFASTASGDRTGALTIVSDSVPFAVALSGSSPIAATITASPTTVMTGTPTKLTWTLSPGTTCTATGGQAGDGWTGAITAGGSRTVMETTAGSYTYGLHCTAGSQTAQPQTTVTVTWPPVDVSVSASPATMTTGQSTTVTWSSPNATGCSATGGGPGDNWPGTKATSGSQVMNESYALATTSVTLSFTVNCTSTASGLSGQGSTKVVENTPPAATKSGGGGAFDRVSLISLCILFGLHAVRRSLSQKP